MESSPLNRIGSAPAMESEHTANGSSSKNSIPDSTTVEAVRGIGQQHLSQGRSKSQSLRTVLTRFTDRFDTQRGIQIEHLREQQSPHLSTQHTAHTTWPKIQGKPGCLLGDAARAACGLDDSTLKAATSTANLLNCVIAIRSVASGALDAMKNGAVPKGLPVKGKSSNFGPHNALIPRDPRLSKNWNDTANIEYARAKTESALAAGKVKCAPLVLDTKAIAAMVSKGLIALNLNHLEGESDLIQMESVDGLGHPNNPAASFRLMRKELGVGEFTGEFTDTFPDKFIVEYTIRLTDKEYEPWKPLEVLANEELKPYTADFDLFTLMPKCSSPLLTEEMNNFKNGCLALERKFSVSVQKLSTNKNAHIGSGEMSHKTPRVFDFANVEGLDSASPPRRPSSTRTSIVRSPLPLTPIHLYTPKGPKSPHPGGRLALNMSKLQLAAKTVVSMLAHSERSKAQAEVGKESYWESQVRAAFNTAHKSLTKIQVNPVKHGNEQNNPVPEPVENITFIKPNGEIWFAETEPAAMAMIYMAREEGHLGYLNKEYIDARYKAGVIFAEAVTPPVNLNSL